MDLFNPTTGEKKTFEDPAEAQRAILNGTYMPLKNSMVELVDQDGNAAGAYSSSRLQDVLRSGSVFLPDDKIARKLSLQREVEGKEVETGLLSAADMAGFGLPTAFGMIDEERLDAARDLNPIAAGLGDVAGVGAQFGLSALTGGAYGGFGAAARAGKAVQTGITAGRELGVLGRIGAKVAGEATEGLIAGAPFTLAEGVKAFNDNPNYTAETIAQSALMNAGFGALLGGTIQAGKETVKGLSKALFKGTGSTAENAFVSSLAGNGQESNVNKFRKLFNDNHNPYSFFKENDLLKKFNESETEWLERLKIKTNEVGAEIGNVIDNSSELSDKINKTNWENYLLSNNVNLDQRGFKNAFGDFLSTLSGTEKQFGINDLEKNLYDNVLTPLKKGGAGKSLYRQAKVKIDDIVDNIRNKAIDEFSDVLAANNISRAEAMDIIKQYNPKLSIKQLQNEQQVLRNYSERFKVEPSLIQEELNTTRNIVNDFRDGMIDDLGQEIGSAELKELNRQYRTLSTANEMLDKKIGKLMNNRSLSLTDNIWGGAQGVSGALLGGHFGAIAGLVGNYATAGMSAFTNKFLRENGPALVARFGDNPRALSAVISDAFVNTKLAGVANVLTGKTGNLPKIVKTNIPNSLFDILKSQGIDVDNTDGENKEVSAYNTILTGLSDPDSPLKNLFDNYKTDMPNVAAAGLEQEQRIINYLVSKLPKNSFATQPFAPKFNPTKQEIRGFTQAYQVVSDPTIVLDKLAQNKLTKNDVITLKATYPAIYQKMVDNVKAAGLEKNYKLNNVRKQQIALLLDDQAPTNFYAGLAANQAAYSNNDKQEEMTQSGAGKINNIPQQEQMDITR